MTGGTWSGLGWQVVKAELRREEVDLEWQPKASSRAREVVEVAR